MSRLCVTGRAATQVPSESVSLLLSQRSRRLLVATSVVNRMRKNGRMARRNWRQQYWLRFFLELCFVR